MIQGKRILIFGGAGSIGSELTRQLCKENKVSIFDNNETAFFDLVEELEIQGRIGDVRDIDAVREAFFLFKPEIVFNCAALKHVTPSMRVPREYVLTNCIGTLNLLDECVKNGVVKYVNISTDKASKCESVMGWSKRGTELFTKIYGGVSVRFGNVLGSRGSVIPIWQKQIDEGRPITVTDANATRFMMTIEEACKLVIKAAVEGKPGETWVMEMGDSVNVLDLAKQILKKSGRDEESIEMIGLRPGEQLNELLMTPEEKDRAEQRGSFWVI